MVFFPAAVGPACTNGAVRLFSAFDATPDNEGVLQICSGGVWRSVCQYYYSCYVGKTACVQLGYKGAVGNGMILSVAKSLLACSLS